MRFSVDPWDPSYGVANGTESPDPSSTTVELSTEVDVASWRPLRPGPATDGHDDGIVFVDGVRRVEARVWLDGPGGAVPGVCASWGAGAVCCVGRTATIHAETIEIGRSIAAPLPAESMRPVSGRHVVYRPVVAKSAAPEDLWLAVQQEMGRAETRISAAIRALIPGALVVVDGPLGGRDHLSDMVGLVKTHHVSYIEGPAAGVLARLEPGERTPVFTINGAFPRHSWYVRLPGARPGIVPLAGVVRCECPVAVTGDALTMLADSLALVLPRYASSPVKDRRAPQNLTPIAGLERVLRHRLGNAEVLYRALRVAAASSLA